MKHKITTVDDIPTPVSEKINDSFVEIFIPSYKIINISGIRIIIMYKGYNELILSEHLPKKEYSPYFYAFSTDKCYVGSISKKDKRAFEERMNEHMLKHTKLKNKMEWCVFVSLNNEFSNKTKDDDELLLERFWQLGFSLHPYEFKMMNPKPSLDTIEEHNDNVSTFTHKILNTVKDVFRQELTCLKKDMSNLVDESTKESESTKSTKESESNSVYDKAQILNCIKINPGISISELSRKLYKRKRSGYFHTTIYNYSSLGDIKIIKKPNSNRVKLFCKDYVENTHPALNDTTNE